MSNKHTYRDSPVLMIYGNQLFLARAKIKDARSCRGYRQRAVYVYTCAGTSSFETERKREISQLNQNWELSAAGKMGGTCM